MSQTILAVDDNHDAIMILSAVLKRAGYRVITAVDGAQAIERAKEQRPELILLDLMMPKMDGFEVCRVLKNDPEMKNTPIFMFTARSDLYSQKEGLALGACEFLKKPLHPRDLIQKIKEHLPPPKPPPATPGASLLSLLGFGFLLWSTFNSFWSLLISQISDKEERSPGRPLVEILFPQ